MKLTEAEAAKFWPIYREYEAEHAALGERKVALIREFLTRSAACTLDDASSAMVAEDWLDLQQDRLIHWRNDYKRIARAISPLRGGQFLRVENQMALFIDLNIAAEMPTVAAPGNRRNGGSGRGGRAARRASQQCPSRLCRLRAGTGARPSVRLE